MNEGGKNTGVQLLGPNGKPLLGGLPIPNHDELYS